MTPAGSWIVHPRARLGLRVSVPRRRQGFATLECELSAERLALLAALLLKGKLPEDPAQLALLAELGLIVEADQLPEEVYLQARFDGTWPAHLPYARRQRLRHWPALQLNPALQTCLPAGFPASVWPPATPAWWWPPGEGECGLPVAPDVALQERLQTHAGSLLEDPWRGPLATAGLLVPQRPGPSRLAVQRSSVAETLDTRGFAILRRVMRPLQLACLRDYLHRRAAEGYFHLGSRQVARRDLLKQDPLLDWLHAELGALLNRLLPEPVKPSYQLVALYHETAELLPHTDRRQCAWNVSWVFDLQPECEQSEAWPLAFEHRGRQHDVRLEIGDLVLYRGTDTKHWRPPLPRGQQALIGLFHFVAPDFAGPLD